MTKTDLHAFVAEGKGNESTICQVYAIKDGTPVFHDEWRGFQTDDTVNVMSVTKGIMAILVGIALDRGYIESTEQKVLDFFPDYRTKRGEKTIREVRLEHLLTMTAPYKYRSEPWVKVCTSKDWTKAALDLLGGRAGITGEFKYSTLGIQILAGVIESAAGKTCIEFANETLFAPLGLRERMVHAHCSKDDLLEYMMGESPHKNEWYADPAGIVTAGWGLSLSACEMAVIGRMLMNGGICGGKQILSQAWITRMTSPLLKLGEKYGCLYYGYLWYRPDEKTNVFAVIGDGGNVIYVNPDKNISVGVTGIFKPGIYDRIDFIEEKVLPLVEGI